MIRKVTGRFHLTWLLQSVFHVTSYRYLRSNELSVPSVSSYRSNLHKHIASRSEIPFHVLVVYDNIYCSGTLIRSRIVLTAASCFLVYDLKRLVVKLGAPSITANGQIIPVIDIKIHEYYSYQNKIDNDIAMLMLKSHAEFNQYVKKAILAEPDVVLRAGVSVEVSGWGSSNVGGSNVNQLLWTEMIILSKANCNTVYPHLSSPSNYCAKYQPDRRLSDNGGPAVYNRELVVGILSYGGISQEKPYVAILTNISYFNRWIVLNTRRFLEKYCVEHDDSYGLTSVEELSESAGDRNKGRRAGFGVKCP